MTPRTLPPDLEMIVLAMPRPPRGPGDGDEDELPMGDPPDDDETDDPDDEDEGEEDDEPLQTLARAVRR